MAARKRAQDRDFNRRRWMILDKGMDMAYNQRGTALGDCLLKWNVREETLLKRRQRMLQRQGDISVGFKEQEKKLFVVLRDQAIREPTLLLERTPSAEQYSNYVDLNQPRYMRPLKTRQSKTPEFSTFSVFQAVKKRKRNPWEEAVKEDVQFRPTLCPCARLNSQDAEKLLTDWAVVNEKQTKALGLRTDNRSAPVKQVRTGLNPLHLPPRLNSQLHLLAHNLLDGISTPGDTEDSSLSDAGSVGSVVEDYNEEDERQQPQTPVFVTQLLQKTPQPPQTPARATSSQKQARRTPPQQQAQKQPSPTKQQQQQQQHQELVVFETRDNTQKEKQMAHKRQVDSALINIYDMLDRRRPKGQPRLRHANDGGTGGGANSGGRSTITYAHRHQPGGTSDDVASSTLASTSVSANPSRMSTSQSATSGHRWRMEAQQPQQPQQLRTTCRTAESVRILMESRRRRTAAGGDEQAAGRSPAGFVRAPSTSATSRASGMTRTAETDEADEDK